MILFSISVFADASPVKPLLVFGCDRDYYPLSSTLDDELIGFDIELIHRIAEYGRFRAEIKAGDWASVLQLLQDGKVDAVSGIIRTDSRLNHFDFSIPYLTEYYSVFVRADSSFETIEDLLDGDCAALEGDAILETFIIPNGFDEGLIQVASFDEAFEIVGSGAADYVIAPYSMGLSVMAKFSMKELELYERSLMTVDYRFAVKKGSGHLFIINETLSSAALDGVLESLKNEAEFSRQFPVPSSTGRTRILYLFFISAMFLLLVLFIGAALRMKSRLRCQQLLDENIILRRVIEALPLGVSWQFAGQEAGGWNQSWLKYSEESAGFQTNNDDFKVEYYPVSGDDGSPEGVVRTAECCKDYSKMSARFDDMISDLAFRDVEIERMRITDQQTGLFNYSYLGIRVKQEIERYHLYGQKFCIFSIEIKDRSVENLVITAKSIRAVLRRSDITAYNGNGIIIIILPKTNCSEADELLKKILTIHENEGFFSGSVYELPAESESLLPAEIRELSR